MTDSRLPGLVKASQRGDVEAFGALVETYQGTVFAMAYSYVRRFHEAEDLAQEVFIRAFEGVGGLEKREKFPSWLGGITSNVCMDWLRRRKPEGVSLENVQPPEAPDPALGSLLNEQNRQIARELDAAIRELTPACRQAILLRYFENLSYKEIGAFLDVPVSTVRGQLYRATQALRKRVSGELEDLR